MGTYIYHEIGGNYIAIQHAFPAPVAIYVTEIDGEPIADAPVEYTAFPFPVKIDNALLPWTIRNAAMKTFVDNQGGWGAVSARPDVAIIASYLVCTGAQMLTAIPDYNTRYSIHCERLKVLRGTPCNSSAGETEQLIVRFWCTLFASIYHIDISGISAVYKVAESMLFATPFAANELTTTGEQLYKSLFVRESGDVVGYLGILDFMKSKAGTRFDGAGFFELLDGTGTPEGDFADFGALRDYLIDILENGGSNDVTFTLTP